MKKILEGYVDTNDNEGNVCFYSEKSLKNNHFLYEMLTELKNCNCEGKKIRVTIEIVG